MNGGTAEKVKGRLYNLLPAIYRIRDVEGGEPLRALLEVIEGEFQALEDDIANLYRNSFIETCDEWVVPYVGDLLGVRWIQPINTSVFSQRALVANTIRYRRRKGTVFVLEQLARDAMGWPARAVEFLQLLITTQNLNHLRPSNLGIPDLRDFRKLELLGSPFESIAHTVDVRHIDNNRGKYNIPNIGLFLWRLQGYPITKSTARAVSEPTDGRYTFNPIGYDQPLFNNPQEETEIAHLAEEVNVLGTLRRRVLFDELESRRQALVDGKAPKGIYFRARQPVLQVFVGEEPVPPEEILICDLSDCKTNNAVEWPRPETSKTYKSAEETDVERPIRVAVDPELGRLAFPSNVPLPERVLVSYSYGFSGDVGSGPYDRQDFISRALLQEVTWQVGVSKEKKGDPKIFSTLGEAVGKWNDYAKEKPGAVGIIAVMDSYSYEEGEKSIEIITTEGSQLLIVACDWPDTHVLGQIVPNKLCPHLLVNLSVKGTYTRESPDVDERVQGSMLMLDGLLIEGSLAVEAGNIDCLRVTHCTLVPSKDPSLSIKDGQESRNRQLNVYIERSICGPITITSKAPTLNIVDSIVDGTSGGVIDAPAVDTKIETSTVFGSIDVQSLEAGNSIFTGMVMVERRQIGCARFCFIPGGSRTPRRYHCQPDLALRGVTDTTEQERIQAKITPSFTSVHYGECSYSQLSQTCPTEIRTGAEDGSEMGVFSFLKQPQREDNLRIRLGEYLPFGLEVGIFHVN